MPKSCCFKAIKLVLIFYLLPAELLKLILLVIIELLLLELILQFHALFKGVLPSGLAVLAVLLHVLRAGLLPGGG